MVREGTNDPAWKPMMEHSTYGSLAPGRQCECKVNFAGTYGMAAVEFTDVIGTHWRRQGNDVASSGHEIQQLRESLVAQP